MATDYDFAVVKGVGTSFAVPVNASGSVTVELANKRTGTFTTAGTGTISNNVLTLTFSNSQANAFPCEYRALVGGNVVASGTLYTRISQGVKPKRLRKRLGGIQNTTQLAMSAFDSYVLSLSPVSYNPLNGSGNNLVSGMPSATPFGNVSYRTAPNGDLVASLDGSSAYFDLGDNDKFSPSNTGAFTVSVLISPDVIEFPAQEGTGYVHFAGKNVYSPNNCEWALRAYSFTNTESRPNRLSGYAFNTAGGLGVGSYAQYGTTQWPSGLGAFAPGAWYLMTLVIQGTYNTSPTGYTKLYLNGQLIDTDLLNSNSLSIAPSNTTAPVRIGTANKGSYWDGAIGKFAIWNRELTAQEISNIYSQSRI